MWRRGEGVEPSGERNARQAGFEDRWGHRAPSSSIATHFSGCRLNAQPADLSASVQSYPLELAKFAQGP
jgi:hypothetical protein